VPQFSLGRQMLSPHIGTQSPPLQVRPDPHSPQLPPHPSGPHSLPVQLGVQHVPLLEHTAPELQGQSWGQLLQFSPEVQTPLPHTAAQTPPWQVNPTPQMPQLPWQPSSPHALLVQFGMQQVPLARQVAPDAHVQSEGQFAQVSPD